MNALDLVRRLHEHRAWVNAQLLQAAGSLSDEQLRQPFPIGQGSIWMSLVHLYAAEYIWLATLEGDTNPLVPGDLPGKIPGNQQGGDGLTSLADLTEKWKALESRWQTYLDKLTPEPLEDIIYKVTTSGKKTATRRSDILQHVCMHAHYTTAQVINMLRHAGAKNLPDVMLISMARQQMAGS